MEHSVLQVLSERFPGKAAHLCHAALACGSWAGGEVGGKRGGSGDGTQDVLQREVT